MSCGTTKPPAPAPAEAPLRTASAARSRTTCIPGGAAAALVASTRTSTIVSSAPIFRNAANSMCPFGDGAALSDSRTTNRGDPLVRVTSTSARVNGNGSKATRRVLVASGPRVLRAVSPVELNRIAATRAQETRNHGRHAAPSATGGGVAAARRRARSNLIDRADTCVGDLKPGQSCSGRLASHHVRRSAPADPACARSHPALPGGLSTRPPP